MIIYIILKQLKQNITKLVFYKLSQLFQERQQFQHSEWPIKSCANNPMWGLDPSEWIFVKAE